MRKISLRFCLNEKLIVESTKLPLKYYDLDAAIIFSDILLIPWAMERNVKFMNDFGSFFGSNDTK